MGPLCRAGGSGIAGNGESTSGPKPDSVSGGGVMGGISNSSSPKLGVWKVCKRENKERRKLMRKLNLQGLNQTALFKKEHFSGMVIHLSASALRCNAS